MTTFFTMVAVCFCGAAMGLLAVALIGGGLGLIAWALALNMLAVAAGCWVVMFICIIVAMLGDV